MGVSDLGIMLLSPCFLEEDYALVFPNSYDYSRLPPSAASNGISKHERSKSAPLDDANGFSWDVWTPVYWDCDELERKRKHRQALEQDVVLLQMRLREEQATRASLEKALVSASSCLSSCCQSIAAKTRELIAETALIEREVAHLEQRALWLYRKLLSQSGSNGTVVEQHQSHKIVRFITKKHHRGFPDLLRSPLPHHDIKNTKSSFRDRLASTKLSATLTKASPLHHFLTALQPKLQTKLSEMPETEASPGYGSSSGLDFLGTANELSESLVRSMVNIYFKLADMPLNSPSPMFSSSSGGSSSPLMGGLLSNPFQLNKQIGDCGAYSFMVEVSWICVDSQQLGYAAQALHEFKTLVKQLTTVDPNAMDCDEKLAFWINVYNALVMHAHLAYGIPNGRSKRESLLQKAAYKVGNNSINALTIAQCILGCRSDPQISGQWFQTLLSPLTKLMPREDQRFPYGLSTSEPLVCFALSSGARSDPAVRIYTPKNVKAQLRAAKLEFLQASVGVGSKQPQAVILPKVLEGFLNEAGVSNRGLLQWLCHNLPEQHSIALKNCFRRTKCCEWLPYNYSFRYIFSRDSIDGLL